MTGAGELTDRVTFLKAEAADDGYGNEVRSWTDYRTVWARVIEPLGREVVASGRVGEEATATVRVRGSAAIRAVTPADVLRFSGHIWNIKSGPVPVLRARDFVEFLVERGVPTGVAT